MLHRLSRFERRILLAIFLTGIAPFVISLIYIPRMVESRFALSVHEQVRMQLEASALFYKEFFDAKKREFAARAEAMARDPVLLRAARRNGVEDVTARLGQLVEDNEDVYAARVFGPDHRLVSEVMGPEARRRPEITKKTVTFPLGLGDGPRLEIVFILPLSYIEDRDRAEEVATLYGTALQMGVRFQREHLVSYIILTSAALLLALGVGWMIARGVTRRVLSLALATERVAGGELDFALTTGGHDEITELTRGFNRMIAEVRESRDRIVYLEKVSGWQEFARRLAHEIKNPLTPIQLAIQELRRRAPAGDETFQRFVGDISAMVEEEIAALTRLVDEFSQFARLPEVVPQRVELGAFIEEFLSAYNRFEPDAEVELEMPGEPIFVNLDRVLMRRVLWNLATNAIQAAGAGRTKLWITCRSKPTTVEFELADNGPGIPVDQRARVFDPYFTTKSEGTGLGLAFVKKIVLQHGGSVALRPARGGGAAFLISLPRPR